MKKERPVMFRRGALACILVLLSSSVFAQEVSSLETFQHLAVLQDGRIKPLETYAQNILLQFSGKRMFGQKPAIRWLARLLFIPESTKSDKVFLINSPEIPMALSVEPDSLRRYSFSQLAPHYPKLHELARRAGQLDKKARTVVDEEILRINENLKLYAELSFSFGFAVSHPDFTITDPEVRQALQLSAGQTQFSFLDIALQADLIRPLVDSITGKNRTQWSRQEKEVMRIVSALYDWSTAYKDLPLLLVPAYGEDSENWLSPWDALSNGFHSAAGRREAILLREMAAAYKNDRPLEFDLAVRTFSDSISGRAPKTVRKGLERIPLEILYNKLSLLTWAKTGYGLAFVIFLFSLFSPAMNFRSAAFFLILGGFLAHLVCLILRAAILQRPPVTNLYETFIFVGFVSVLLGLILESVNRQWLGIVVAGICGFIFLTIAEKFSAEGDTLRMLIAVLNSNFWLGTHVVSITTGYAGVCVAGILGHVYILQALIKPKEIELLDTTYKNILGVLGFGLAMSFLGTNLGGIWADQSWGRFWGWDPKENGAMLIVLWCAIIFHARIARLIGPVGVAVGSILGIMVVMWAWFGVNLLSVGLHSYGFTSGTAASLLIYAAAQIIFLGITVPIIKRKLR